MSLYHYLFGYRWLLVFEYTETQGYILYGDSVAGLIGTVAPLYGEGLRPRSPWTLYLYHNKTRQRVPLHSYYFSKGGQIRDLFREVERAEPEWQVKIDEPIFRAIGSKTDIPLEPQSAMEIYEASKRGDTLKEKETFWSVMDVIFGPPEP